MSIKLVHGVYTPTTCVLEITQQRLREKGYDPSIFSWSGLDNPLDFFPNDPEVVVVLEASLGSLKETFEFAWEWAAEGQAHGGSRDDSLCTDPDKFFPVEGAEPFSPHTFRWRRMKLDTGFGRSAIEVRDPAISPGVALMFVASQHPKRVAVIDHEKRFGWYIPGIVCARSGSVSGVACIDFDPDGRRVELDVNWLGVGTDEFTVPIYWRDGRPSEFVQSMLWELRKFRSDGTH